MVTNSLCWNFMGNFVFHFGFEFQLSAVFKLTIYSFRNCDFYNIHFVSFGNKNNDL